MKADRSFRLIGIFAVLIFVFYSSCSTTNLEVKIKQEEASKLLGEAYMNQKDYTSALRELLKGEAIYSKDPLLHNDLGLVYMAKEELDLAVHHFKKAIQLKPDFAAARNNLGTAFLAGKDWDQAIECFEAISGNLLYATPHFPLSNLGSAYYNKKNYPLAEKYYLEALKIEPDFVLALRGLGMTYLAMGKVSDAIEKLEAAIKLSPLSAQLYFDLAHAYGIYSDFPKARHAYEKVIELSPDTPLAHDAQKELEKIR